MDGRIVCVGNLSAPSRERIAHQAGLGMSVMKEFWGQGVGGCLIHQRLKLIFYMKKHPMLANLSSRPAWGVFYLMSFVCWRSLLARLAYASDKLFSSLMIREASSGERPAFRSSSILSTLLAMPLTIPSCSNLSCRDSIFVTSLSSLNALKLDINVFAIFLTASSFGVVILPNKNCANSPADVLSFASLVKLTYNMPELFGCVFLVASSCKIWREKVLPKSIMSISSASNHICSTGLPLLCPMLRPKYSVERAPRLASARF